MSNPTKAELVLALRQVRSASLRADGDGPVVLAPALLRHIDTLLHRDRRTWMRRLEARGLEWARGLPPGGWRTYWMSVFTEPSEDELRENQIWTF